MQFAVKNSVFEADIVPERRDPTQRDDRALGRVLSCDGARATIGTRVPAHPQLRGDGWSIGQLISINLGATRVVGLVHQIRALSSDWNETGSNPVQVEVELLGEIAETGAGARFQNGISAFPPVGALAHRIRSGDLALVHDLGSRQSVPVGTLSQDDALPATVCMEDMLCKHFAVLGTTGVGKSSAVSLLLRRAVASDPDLRVLVLDPHNEYAHAFPDTSVVIDAPTLDLPFWMFRIDELEDVVFRGRAPVEDEADILREIVSQARARYRQPAAGDFARDLGMSLLRRPLDGGREHVEAPASASRVEAPTPYRMKDVFAVLDELTGLHEQRYPRAALRALRVRLESLHADPRYDFMFARANMIETMAPVIQHVFRLPHRGRPISVFQLAGLPSEVVNAVASVLSRLAFELALASRGGYRILLLCEEAHRYVPADAALGFLPTRQAIARIAKEGRKYGAYLGIVTQRPGELDPTILSQCSTIFAMRLANERDQQIIRSAIAAASASTIGFLSSIGNREAIAFGEGVATTMRMRFAELPAHELPAVEGVRRAARGRETTADELVARLGGN